MPQHKIVSAADAVALIQPGDTVATAGFVGVGFAEHLATALEQRFLETGQPENLSLVYAAGQGDGGRRGLNHLAHPGMVHRVVGGHWGLVPELGRMARDNEIEAYNLPQGVICHLFRDIAAGKPGTLTHVGLHTFVDPRQDGGRLNQRTPEGLVRLMEVDGEEFLFYKAFPIQVALLRGTTADPEGNVSMEKEALPLESLAIAQAVKNSGGVVIVQVERLTQHHRLHPSMVRLPGILVDRVVVAPAEEHWQTFGEAYNPAYTGEVEADTQLATATLDERKLIARRALFELRRGATINLGIGMPETLAPVAAEEELLQQVTATIEPGGIGGLPAGGLSFGAVSNPQSVIDQPAQFDFYDGGGLDQAFLGMAQVSPEGHVNVSRFGPKIAGAGGFINISQNAREIYFMGTFLSGKPALTIDDQGIRIGEERGARKFVRNVEQITFNGQYAAERGQRVLYITERCVFELTQAGLKLVELAPGVDLDRDVLAQMEFRPLISDQLQVTDRRVYRPGAMNLRHHGSAGIADLRRALACAPHLMF